LKQKIGKYEILAELGQGAMGTVYRARDPVLDRLVALKTVSPGLLSKRETFQRFEREARAAARLQHRNIVTIYELGEVEGTLFIAMELLEGMDLAHAMSPRDRLSVPHKVQIVVDVCRGLDFAHKRGVVHRDVKPANILILPDGTVKLVDFGIARLEDSSMTRTGLILGTPSYMSPEVLTGQRVDHRADMWATGVLLYEMLSGKPPFEGDTIPTVVYKVINQPPPPLDPVQVGAPPGLLEVVARALAKDPAQRYLDMAQMGAELQAVMGLSGAAETPLFGAAREQACQRDLEEARRLLAANDLERALEAARRARALDPSRTEVVALVRELEDRLADSPTLPSVPALRTADLVLIETPPRAEAAKAPAEDPRTRRVEPLPPVRVPQRRLPTDVLTELRARGASVFRELATFGEPPATTSACLSPARDRNLLATSSTDGSVRLWDLSSRTLVLRLRTQLHQRSGHDALAAALAFSPDGALLAAGHIDGHVHLWNMATGEELPVRMRHEASVAALAFAPNGSALASGGMDSNLKLWHLEAAMAGEARRELHRQPSPVTALAYAAGGALIVTGHAKGLLRVMEAQSCRLRATLRGSEGQVSLICVAPDGQRIAAVSQDRTIRLFDLASQSQVAVMAGHRRPATSLTFFEDGQHLASVALDNSVQLWDLQARATLAALWGPAEESFAGVALYAGGDHIAVALADGRIRLWGPGS
jgi:serine/threonine-protein kinase